MIAFEAENVEFCCKPSVPFPPPEWRKDGRPIFDAKSLELVGPYKDIFSQELVNQSTDDFTLVLKHAQKKDTGNYSCIEEGGVGEKKYLITLYVTGE
jgi:hypothetical protein